MVEWTTARYRSNTASCRDFDVCAWLFNSKSCMRSTGALKSDSVTGRFPAWKFNKVELEAEANDR